MPKEIPLENVQRYDFFDCKDWMTTKFERTEEGFLKGRAIVTNVGVFTYRNGDGTYHTELRLPEEVFSKASLESLKLKPVTNDHPTEMVTPENIKQYQVGTLGDNPSETTQNYEYGTYNRQEKITDGYHVAIDMIISDKDAIAAVENGKQALSCGYSCSLEKAREGAKWCGVNYDYIQRNIRYNHVAIVDSARAGDNAKIRLDGGAWICDDINKQEGGKEDMTLKMVKLDGVEYQAEAPVITELTKRGEQIIKLDAEVAAKTAELSKVTAERDTQKERADQLEIEVENLKKVALDQAKIDAAVEAKFLLREAAQKAGVEIKADMSDEDVRKAVILSVFPSANLDNKDSTYIQARFDGAVEMLAEKNNAATNSLLKGQPGVPGGDMKKTDAAEARAKMIKKMEDVSRGISQ